jgi:superfamily II DNA or RNA helicase
VTDDQYVVTILPKDEVKIRVKADPGILEEIAEKFTFLVDGYKHMPAYKAGLWDGQIRMFSSMRPTIMKGLLLELTTFCSSRGYRVNVPEPGVFPSRMREMSAVADELKSWASDVTSDQFEDREYQMESFAKLIAMERAVGLSSTSSGKTLMIYRLMRYFSELTGKPALMVTSRTNLVVQSSKDFAIYNPDSSFKTAIMKGDSKITSMRGIDCVISTWQSATKKDSDWFNQFSVIIADEAHGWDSKSCTSIMEKCTQVKYRYAFTGTLSGMKMNRLTLVGLFGPIIKISSTRERIDAGDTADLKIKCVRLSYSKEDRKFIARGSYDPDKRRWKPMTYQEEIDRVISHEGRMRFIVNLAKSLSGNTLVMFNRNDALGKPLHDMLLAAGLKSTLIYGKSDDEERERAREILENGDNEIVTASIGVFSEGMSVNNIRNIICVYPMKGRVRLLQTIGRGLRKASDKDYCYFYDLVDDLRGKSYENHLWKHSMIRCNTYDEEQLEYQWFDYNLQTSTVWRT